MKKIDTYRLSRKYFWKHFRTYIEGLKWKIQFIRDRTLSLNFLVLIAPDYQIIDLISNENNYLQNEKYNGGYDFSIE
jgi:hypothetical protein